MSSNICKLASLVSSYNLMKQSQKYLNLNQIQKPETRKRNQKECVCHFSGSTPSAGLQITFDRMNIRLKQQIFDRLLRKIKYKTSSFLLTMCSYLFLQRNIESKKGAQSRSQSFPVLPHIKFRGASWIFVKLSSRDIFSNVGRIGVGNCWAFNT